MAEKELKTKIIIKQLKEVKEGAGVYNLETQNDMLRQEAINRMAKAICKISCACKYYACGNCTEFLEHYTPDLAESALNALLGGKD